MAASEIQIVNPSNLAKIESFLHDPSYKEIIENSSTFNSRLCAERRMRMPFIDTQTGVAQSHCNLFMTKRQRMPGQKEGQVYTYPAQRWRKSRRQYLTMSSTRWGWSGADNPTETVGEGENSSGVPGEALGGDDSRDGSQTTAKDDPKEWFYDELAMEEMETGEEPDPESDEDYYDDTYANRRKRRGGATPTGPGSRGGRTRKSQPDDTPAKRGRAGRGRKRTGPGTLPYEVPGDGEKPYGCELCGAKYKTRPGLTYHFTHTHKEAAAAAAAAAATSTAAVNSDGDSRDSRGGAHTPPVSSLGPATEYQDSYVTFLNNPAGAPSNAPAPPAPVRRPSPPPRPASADTSSSDSAHAPLVPPPAVAPAPPAPAPAPAPADKPEPRPPGGHSKASPSPYCDFCLGDDRENKKTGTPEQLVSCSDCGRSGHPTCLQFTDNMIVSVRKYRWQCIECKCCSICGTSDNDIQQPNSTYTSSDVSTPSNQHKSAKNKSTKNLLRLASEKSKFLDIAKKYNLLDISKTSILDIPKKSILDIPKKSKILDMPKKSKLLDIKRKTKLLDIKKKSKLLDIQKKCEFLDISKKYKLLDIPKKSSLDIPIKSILDIPKTSKILDIPKKSILDIPKKSILDIPKTFKLDFPKKSGFDIPIKSILDIPKKSKILDIPKKSILDIPKKSKFLDTASSEPLRPRYKEQAFGDSVCNDLEKMEEKQCVIAKKLIADILYHGTLRNLNEQCNFSVERAPENITLNTHPSYASNTHYTLPIHNSNTIQPFSQQEYNCTNIDNIPPD